MKASEITLPLPRSVVPNMPDDVFRSAWHIHMTRCIIDAQEYGSDNEYMVSAVHFRATRTTDTTGEHIQELVCTVRQTYGESFSFDTAPLTVTPPIAMQGLVDFNQFSNAMSNYFKHLVGANGKSFSFGHGVTGRIKNTTVAFAGYAVLRATEPPQNTGWGSDD